MAEDTEEGAHRRGELHATLCKLIETHGFEDFDALVRTARDDMSSADSVARVERFPISAGLAEMRRKRLITQSTLAAEMGLTRGTIARMETGEIRANEEYLVGIARAFRLELPEFLGELAAEIYDLQVRARGGDTPAEEET